MSQKTIYDNEYDGGKFELTNLNILSAKLVSLVIFVFSRTIKAKGKNPDFLLCLGITALFDMERLENR